VFALAQLARVLTVTVGMVLAVGLSASPAAAVTASITLKPSSGPPTSTVTVTGTGFSASETVAVDFSGASRPASTQSSLPPESRPPFLPRYDRCPGGEWGRSAHTRPARRGQPAPAAEIGPGPRWVYCSATQAQPRKEVK